MLSRATHGVWGGKVLPGDKPAELEPIYARLLEQFERRTPIELADAPVPQLPDVTDAPTAPRRRIVHLTTRASSGKDETVTDRPARTFLENTLGQQLSWCCDCRVRVRGRRAWA